MKKIIINTKEILNEARRPEADGVSTLCINCRTSQLEIITQFGNWNDPDLEKLLHVSGFDPETEDEEIMDFFTEQLFRLGIEVIKWV